MRTRFVLNGKRKALVAAIADITGERSEYMRMPTCAYKIGDITVEKDGTVVGDITDIMDGLKTRGFEPEEEEIKLTVSVPIGSGRMIRNIINLIYCRGDMINKALGTDFYVPEALVESIRKMNDKAEILETADHFVTRGISFTEETIIFDTLPYGASPEQIRTFTSLVSMMAGYAREMFRVNTVKPSMENEKYEMRTWLLRLGMIGPEHKEARRVLLENLTGHPAYRTKESEEAARSRRRKTDE